MSRHESLIDVAVVAGVCTTYLVLEAIGVPKRWTFVVLGGAAVAYASYLVWGRTDSWRDLGFRTDNLRGGLPPTVLLTAVAATAILAFGIWQGRTPWALEALVLMALYPVWALAQQVAFQGVLHRSLMELVRSPTLQVLLTALAFASVHIGNRLLFGLTLVAGIAWTLLYRRFPNLWLMAGSHSVLAGLAYPLVLADAPLSRI